MTDKKKLDENQIWTMVMTVLPVVILMNAGNELSNNGGMRVLYAGLFGGLGGLIGFAANFLTQKKSRLLKILATIIVIAISGLTIHFISSKLTDKEILEQEWVTQRIGQIEFDSPTQLKLLTSEIPQSVKWFYDEMNIYSDEGNERMTFFLQTKILIDTLSIENAYSNALEGMLRKININIENVELEVFEVYEDEVSSMFSFDLEGVKVNGYGLMYKEDKILDSVWLIPLKKGYSREYIEEFEAGIITDFE